MYGIYEVLYSTFYAGFGNIIENIPRIQCPQKKKRLKKRLKKSFISFNYRIVPGN